MSFQHVSPIVAHSTKMLMSIIQCTTVRYLPRWLYGMSFLDDGQAGRKQIDKFVTRPFEHVKRQMVCTVQLGSTSEILKCSRLQEQLPHLLSPSFSEIRKSCLRRRISTSRTELNGLQVRCMEVVWRP